MSAAARSAYVFGIYLIVVGGMAMSAPNTLLWLLRLEPTSEPWIRMLGVVVAAIGMLDVACARTNQTGFIRATVGTRTFAALSFSAFVALGLAPATILLFAAIDAAGALWTFLALRGEL
jgi:hypothetical protein